MDVQMCMCALATFVPAWVHLNRGERIWQACLLSPQNNCLWITWRESHGRYLEMTHPGDSLNHVHIRPEREVDSALPGACVSLPVFPPVSLRICACACECLQIQRDMLSLISYWRTWRAKMSQLFIKHKDTHTEKKKKILNIPATNPVDNSWKHYNSNSLTSSLRKCFVIL